MAAVASPSHGLDSTAAKPSGDATAHEADEQGEVKVETANVTNEDRSDTGNEVLQLRIRHLLEENASLCEEFHKLGNELTSSRLSEEMLQDTWKVSNGANARQKMVSQNTFRNMNHAVRTELQRATEVAQQVSELREVQSQLTSVNRQLNFAADLQSRALDDLENRLAGKARQIRKLEMALYQVVSSAQLDPRLEGSIADVVAQCGPLVHSVLSREAQRQAAQLTGQYHNVSESPTQAGQGASAAAPFVASTAPPIPSAPANGPPAGRKKRPMPAATSGQAASLEAADGSSVSREDAPGPTAATTSIGAASVSEG